MEESSQLHAGVLDRLQDIVRHIVDDDTVVLGAETTAEDVPGWDSLANVRIILSAEQAFGIKVSTTDIMGLRNVKDLVQLIAARRSA